MTSARVLADVAAKRAIVRWAEANPVSCGDVHPGADFYHEDGHWQPALLMLASVYADHPDFEQAWLIDVSPAKVREHDV
jgi:hypothetical protein